MTYNPSWPGSPAINYLVFREQNKYSIIYRLCSYQSEQFVNGDLCSFRSVLIGEHMTVTPSLNIVRCYSGLYPGYGECTLQLALHKSIWSAFLPVYEHLLDYALDWVHLFDMGLVALET